MNGHGGARKGAGRRNICGEGAHQRRPRLDPRQPLHITVRLRDNLPNLRQKRAKQALRQITLAAQDFGLNINHFATLKNHIHMVAEVDSPEALERGMRSFNGRLARLLRRLGGSPGPRGPFLGRHHVNVIKTARQMKNTLAYVLLNASKHFKKIAHIDEHSSGMQFKHWRQLLSEKWNGLIAEQLAILEGKPMDDWLPPARTWLATVGWQQVSSPKIAGHSIH